MSSKRPFNRPLPNGTFNEEQRLFFREEYLRRDRVHHANWMHEYRKQHAEDIAKKRAEYRKIHREELKEKARLYRLQKAAHGK